MTGSTHIAIIGGGASGTLVAINLLRTATSPCRISIIEREPRLGRGVAFGTTSECHLLNLPAGKMSAFADDSDHFVRWARTHGRGRDGFASTASDDARREDSVDATSFLPRRLYGAYLDAVLDDAIAAARPGITFQRFADEAIAVDERSTGATIVLHGGDRVAADRVVLALGHLPPRNPPLGDPRFYESARYRGYAWAPDVLADLPIDASILLIGSGLTAVDLALELRRREHRGSVHVLTRHGMLPAGHRATAVRAPFLDPASLPTSTAELMRRLRREIAEARARGEDWRAVIDALRPITPLIWQSLPIDERRRFLRHVRPFWEVVRHRMAPETAASFTAMLQSGQLVVHVGRVDRCVERRHGVVVVLRRRRRRERELLAVARVINCTGPESDFRQFKHPLVASLVADGSIRPDPVALGIDVAPDGAVRNAVGARSCILYSLGPTCKGTSWETTAIPEIRVQAAALARRLLEPGATIAARPSAGAAPALAAAR